MDRANPHRILHSMKKNTEPLGGNCGFACDSENRQMILPRMTPDPAGQAGPVNAGRSVPLPAPRRIHRREVFAASVPEIAAELGCSTKSVERLLDRAIKKMRSPEIAPEVAKLRDLIRARNIERDERRR